MDTRHPDCLYVLLTETHHHLSCSFIEKNNFETKSGQRSNYQFLESAQEIEEGVKLTPKDMILRLWKMLLNKWVCFFHKKKKKI